MQPLDNAENFAWLIIGLLFWALAIAINYADRAA
jgi:hypothetical protein